MIPSAASFRKLLQQVFLQSPEGGPTITVQTASGPVDLGERQLLISCVLASADAVEKLEAYVGSLAQGLGSLAMANEAATQGGAPGATGVPGATAPAEEEYEDMPPLATAVASAPVHATSAPGKIVTTSAPVPIVQTPNGQGIVTTSAPTPIAPRS